MKKLERFNELVESLEENNILYKNLKEGLGREIADRTANQDWSDLTNEIRTIVAEMILDNDNYKINTYDLIKAVVKSQEMPF